MTAILSYLSTIPERVKIDPHRERTVVCADCGPSQMTKDECQWCGGIAYPVTNWKLVNRHKEVKSQAA